MASTVGYMQIMKSFLSLRVSTLIDLTCLLHLLLDGWMDGMIYGWIISNVKRYFLQRNCVIVLVQNFHFMPSHKKQESHIVNNSQIQLATS